MIAKKSLVVLVVVMLFSVVSAFEYCEDGVVNENDLRIVSVDDMLKENSVEWVWQTNEKVELEVRVQNREDTTEDYVLELAFVEDDEIIELVEDDNDLYRDFALDAEERETIIFNFEVEKDIDKGDYELFVKFYKDGDEDGGCVEDGEVEIEITKIELCEEGSVDEDDLKIKGINDYTKNVDEEWTWNPGKEIKVSVDIKNKEFEDAEFDVELFFLDKSGEIQDIVKDSSELRKSIEIEEDDDAEVAFDFELQDSIEDDYFLYARVQESSDDEICTSMKASSESDPVTISVEKRDREIVIREVNGPSKVSKGGVAEFVVEIANLGEKDEEKVNLIIYDANLGLKEEVEIDNLDSGESTEVVVSVDILRDLNITSSRILFTAEYDYDSDKDFYNEMLDEEVEVMWDVEIVEGEVAVDVNDSVVGSNESVVGSNDTEVVEEELVEEINQTEEEVEKTTIITGQAVGGEEGSMSFVAVLFLIVLAVVGVFFLHRRSKRGKGSLSSKEYTEPEFRTRKYVASLD